MKDKDARLLEEVYIRGQASLKLKSMQDIIDAYKNFNSDQEFNSWLIDVLIANNLSKNLYLEYLEITQVSIHEAFEML